MPILINSKPVLIIFSSVHFVKGATKTLLIDVQRNKSIQLPVFLAEIIQELNKKNIFDYLDSLNTDDKVIFEEYLDFLIENEVIFFVPEELKHSFPNTSLDYESPHTISNLIMDVSNENLGFINEIFFKEIGMLGVQAVQLRGLSENILKITEYFELTRVRDIEIVLFDRDFPEEFNFEKLKIAGVFCIFVSELKLKELLDEKLRFTDIDIIFNEKMSASLIKNSCGLIAKRNFNYNQHFFLETLHHNSCLNRKISIDSKGNIKNCPSMNQTFGNIKNTSLEEAISHPDFKKYWDITKDKIHVCKDCEFRYICTDCRAYVEDPEDIYSKPLKCGYNPYSGEWSDWSTNPLKQKAIEYYGLSKVVELS